MAKTGRGLTIARRDNGSYRAQIRKRGFPYQSRDFLTADEADRWGIARLNEIQATGRLIDRRPAERVTLRFVIEQYVAKITKNRPGETSKIAEEARLRRFMRDEKWICDHALAHITTEMFEDWRDRRLKERPSSAISGRGEEAYSRTPPPGRLRKDGTPRSNAASPKSPKKPPGTISPGTVKREITLLKGVFDFARRNYKLATNPLDKEVFDRPSVQDARTLRISDEQWARLLGECRKAKSPWLAVAVELALEIGARRGSLLKLCWEDLQLDKGTATLVGVKNSRQPSEVRTVTIGLSPRARQLLADLPGPKVGLVIPVKASVSISASD